ncbi:MAG: DUF169 domain-containing protein [Deltaproteobacteria bacterium]
MDELTDRLRETLEDHCRPATMPVAIKLVKEGNAPLPKAKYPLDHAGHRMAVCQGMTLARTIGWVMAFRDKDYACPLPRVFMGHIEPDALLQGAIADYYQDDPECQKIMEATYPKWPLDAYKEIWLAPMNRCEFVPDLAVAYGNPAQVLALIQGANYGIGSGIKSASSGRFGCSTWIAGVVQAGECTYMVPGPGERVFAGTQDHEMSFAVPYSRFGQLIEGLKYVRSKGAYRYPVPNLAILSEARIPEKYHSIEPSPRR